MVVRAPYLAAASAALIGTLVVALLSGISDPAIAVPTWLVSAAVASAAMRPRHTDQLAPS